jgi:hypothetical protein
MRNMKEKKNTYLGSKRRESRRLDPFHSLPSNPKPSGVLVVVVVPASLSFTVHVIFGGRC